MLSKVVIWVGESFFVTPSRANFVAANAQKCINHVYQYITSLSAFADTTTLQILSALWPAAAVFTEHVCEAHKKDNNKVTMDHMKRLGQEFGVKIQLYEVRCCWVPPMEAKINHLVELIKSSMQLAYHTVSPLFFPNVDHFDAF